MTIEALRVSDKVPFSPTRGFSTIKEAPPKVTRRGINIQLREKLVDPLFQTDHINFELDATEVAYLRKVKRALGSKKFKAEIEKGNLALVLIRPHAENNIAGISDEEMVTETIQKFEAAGLKTVFVGATIFKSEDVEKLAGHTKARQSEILPSRYTGFGQVYNRWEEFVDLMTSGAVTFVYFYSPDGNAIEKSRATIGHWDLNQNTTLATLRGEFGLRDKESGRSDNYSNLVHGSDQPIHVLDESQIITRTISRLVRNSRISNNN